MPVHKTAEEHATHAHTHHTTSRTRNQPHRAPTPRSQPPGDLEVLRRTPPLSWKKTKQQSLSGTRHARLEPRNKAPPLRVYPFRRAALPTGVGVAHARKQSTHHAPGCVRHDKDERSAPTKLAPRRIVATLHLLDNSSTRRLRKKRACFEEAQLTASEHIYCVALAAAPPAWHEQMHREHSARWGGRQAHNHQSL